MVFGVFDFLQKTNERIRLYYYDTSSRLVFVRFLEEIEDAKKPFRNYLTFNPVTIFCKTGLIYTFSCLMTFDVENTFLKYFFEKITKRGKMIDLFDTKIHLIM